MWKSYEEMPATIGGNRQGRPMTTKGRPVIGKARPKTTKGRRFQQGSVESLESRTSSEQTGEESTHVTISINDSSEDKRLVNRSRAHTAPSSKYHSSCSLSSTSSESLNGSNHSNNTRSKSMQDHPCPDNVCRVSNNKPGYYEFLRPYSAYTKPLWKEPRLPQAFQDSRKLNHPSLNDGERFYLWRTASVYGMTNMRKQNQKRYEKKLRHTVETGFHTEEEIQKYLNYFKGSRKRQFHTDPSIWREPPRIPVRQLRFRPPPSSPRGWNSFSPQGNLGRGRGHSANSMSPESEKSDSKEKNEEQEQKKRTLGRKKRAPGVSSVDDDEAPKKHENEDEKLVDNQSGNTGQQSNADSPADRRDSDEQDDNEQDYNEQENDEQEEPAVHIYYDMKLKRTVIKPSSPGSKKDEKEKYDYNNKAMKSKEKVSFKLDRQSKEENKLKGQNQSQGKRKSPRQKQSEKVSPRPPPPRRSWEKNNTDVSPRPPPTRRSWEKSNTDVSPRPPPTSRSWDKNNTDASARPKTGRGRSNRHQTVKRAGEHLHADEKKNEARGSLLNGDERVVESMHVHDEDNAGDAPQSSASTSRASSSGTSRVSSSGTSRSSSSTASSSSTSSSSRSSSSRSYSAISNGESSDSGSGRNSSRNGTPASVIDNEKNNKLAPIPPRVSFREASDLSGDEVTRPKVPSAVGNRVIEGDEDESRAALAQSFWGRSQNKDDNDQKPNEETASISSPGKTDTSFGSSDSSTSGTSSGSGSSSSDSSSSASGRSSAASSAGSGDNANKIESDMDKKLAPVPKVTFKEPSDVSDNEATRSKVVSAAGNQVIDGGDDESQKAPVQSFWDRLQNKDESEQKSKVEIASPGRTDTSVGSSGSSTSGTISSSSGSGSGSSSATSSSGSDRTDKAESNVDNNKLVVGPRVSFIEPSDLSDDESTRPNVASAVGNRIIDGDDDESRIALAQSFWGRLQNKDEGEHKAYEETASISSPGRTDTSVGSSDSSTSGTNSSSSGSSSSGSSSGGSYSGTNSSSSRTSSVIGQGNSYNEGDKTKY